MTWPPTSNWEGGTTIGGRRLYHEPYVGWRDDGPAHDSPYLRPSRVGRSRLAARSRRRRRAFTAITTTTVLGYSSIVGGCLFTGTLTPAKATTAILGTGTAILIQLATTIRMRRHRTDPDD